MRKATIIWALVCLGVLVTQSGCALPEGAPGKNGTNGRDGAKGKDGQNGISPTFVVRPATPYECAAGGTAILTSTPAYGFSSAQQQLNVVCNGTSGMPGMPGMPGQNGTLVTPVKLCPGDTQYPSTFVEYGMCIDSKLYGVYSANGGFLAYLPNGDYTSDGINSRCNLNVNGCTVTPK